MQLARPGLARKVEQTDEKLEWSNVAEIVPHLSETHREAMVYETETAEHRSCCEVPWMWEFHQPIIAQSDPRKLLIVFLLSFPKDRNKSYLRGRADKPEVTELRGCCHKNQRMVFLGPKRNADTLVDVRVEGFWCLRIYRILLLIGCSRRKTGAWEPTLLSPHM